MPLFGPNTQVASAARTATGTSAAIVVISSNVALLLACTAASGTTPTLDVTVEWSADGSAFFSAQPADSFSQLTAAGGGAKLFPCKAAFYRVKWTLAGTTPSFTFSVSETTL